MKDNNNSRIKPDIAHRIPIHYSKKLRNEEVSIDWAYRVIISSLCDNWRTCRQNNRPGRNRLHNEQEWLLKIGVSLAVAV